ncbi:hypothetical protein SAMN05444149_108105 [Pseudosulfitobacter pseudonitzschiae]|uniref:Uncharacterized protein n=1 Tax=Pseudosulfitobacter pseudonitzschiae TaxID=1402135 RepID=A0A073J8F6_9RHOB|nr:hypothetical protein [Pseudosulfitobacter pseudonitzschiae]KEJ93987.1 hypothetical protein SUH3_12005 [Pseudosulfitobacter pseudonitzschiae]SHG01791.1 hypothetical protein SAMN05444149_108105 [Pseudosulfitobacter pseudonitzschiae]
MAAQNIGNLKVSIGADTKDLARGIGRAKALMSGLSRVAQVSGVAAGAAFAAASAGLIAMTKGGLEAVDAQAKMARSVDGTIDGLRALQIAGSDAGVAVSEMNGAVQMMGKRLSEAAREGSGPAHDALKMLGLDARELMKMDVDERFGAIADKINEMGLSAQDAAGIMREFGVRSNEVSLALLQGSGAIQAARGEVSKFGLSMSGEMAAGVEAANDAMSRIAFVFEGMRNKLAVGLAPVLHDLALNFQAANQAGGPLQGVVESLVGAFSNLATTIMSPEFLEAATLFGVTIANAVSGLANFMVVLADNAEIAGIAMVGLGAAMAFFSGPIGLAIAAVAGGIFLLSTRFGESQTAAELADKAYRDLQAALAVVDRSNAAAVASGEQLIATHIDQGRAALEAAKAELALARAKQTAGNALLDQNPLTAGGNSGYAEAMAENTAAAEAQLTAAEAQLERYQKTLEGFKRSQYPTQGTGAPSNVPADPDGSGGGGSDPLSLGKLNENLENLITTIDPAKARLDQLTAAQKLLKQALDEGVITQDEYNLRLSQVNEKFKEVPANAGAAAKGVRGLSKEAKKAKDASDEVKQGWESAFSSLIDNIDQGTDALKSFIIEALKMTAINGISRFLGGSDWFDGPLIGKNALGTDNWRGGLSWVGEKGPELVNLPMGAQVIPNSKLGGGGGGMSFTYAPKIDARGASLAAVQELEHRLNADAAQFNGKVQQAVLKAQSGRKLP